MKLVLVVEDEHGNAEVVQLLLEAAGYRVATASNGKEALQSMQEEKPALILTDYMMPIMNGAELGQAVRRDAELAHIPFIFMSGTSEDVVRKAFRDYDAFIPKPFELDSLLPLIARLVEAGRAPAPSTEEVGESMRQLLKGIQLPPEA